MFRLRQRAVAASAVLTAMAVAEIAMRPLSASWHYPSGPVRTIRQYNEGTATAHFAADGIGTYGNRLTGRPVLKDVPLVTLVGDSHLLQEAVPDEATVGSVVEERSRNRGKPVNVRQYGWYDTGIATYLGVAPAILKAAPAAVVVVVNEYDFGVGELLYSDYWRMRIAPDLTVTLRQLPEVAPAAWRDKAQDLFARSALTLALTRRINLILDAASSPSQPSAQRLAEEAAAAEEAAHMPLASVRALRAAYGDRLLMVYTPWCRPACQPEMDPMEKQVLEACRASSVDCFSIRDQLNVDQKAFRRFDRGFHNTAPGQGHLNRYGLAVLGGAIWEHLQQRL